jgi:hypothetical protein
VTAYVIQSPPHAGATLTETIPALTGNTSPCGNGVGLLVKNGSGSSITVTVHIPAAITHDGLVVPNRVVTVPATSDAVIPMVAATYGDPVTGLATFDVSAITTVLCAVIAIGA